MPFGVLPVVMAGTSRGDVEGIHHDGGIGRGWVLQPRASRGFVTPLFDRVARASLSADRRLKAIG